MLEYRAEEGEHHCGSCRIAYEHREQGGHKHKAQQDVLALLTERSKKHAGKVDVQTGLGGGDGQDKASDEEHYYRIGKTCHNLLIAQQLSCDRGVAHPLEAGIGSAEQQQHHYRY